MDQEWHASDHAHIQGDLSGRHASFPTGPWLISALIVPIEQPELVMDTIRSALAAAAIRPR